VTTVLGQSLASIATTGAGIPAQASSGAEAALGDLGIIGARQLIAVQTFDIARLTSHPVVLRPACFIAVTGRGPTDSNESGKTSFNAAVALLLGDPEWRVTGGGVSTVGELLFEPDTAGVAAAAYPAAQHGYIVGLFADPDSPAATAHTVWLRLSSTAAYLTVRHAPGTHLVEGATDRERHAGCGAAWASLPSASELGARSFAAKLYGRSPRCLAYVASRGSQRSGPSLLKMEAGAFTPEAIGAALVRQTGRADALEAEQQQRAATAARHFELENVERDGERAFLAEERTLAEVTSRAECAAALEDGQRLWRLHYARGLLDVLDRKRDLEAELHEAKADESAGRTALQAAKDALAAFRDDSGLTAQVEQAKVELDARTTEIEDARTAEGTVLGELKALGTRLTELEAAGARDARLGEAAGERALQQAGAALRRAERELDGAQARHDGLEVELQQLRSGGAGRAGRTVAALAALGIEAYALIDDVALDEEHRLSWQARLEPWADAVVVTGTTLADTVVALSSEGAHAGAVLIDGARLPAQAVTGELAGELAGVTARPETTAFLAALAELAPLAEHDHWPAGTAVVSALAVTVLGGHPEPTTGRAHRLARLEAMLSQAQTALGEVRGAATAAEGAHRLAQEELDAARVAAEYARLQVRHAAIETGELAGVRARLAELEPLRAAADAQHVELVTANASTANRKREFENGVRDAEADLTAATIRTTQLSTELGSQATAYWAAGWGGTPQGARAALGWPAGDEPGAGAGGVPTGAAERRSQRTLAIEANRALDRIVGMLRIDARTGENAPTAQIAAAVAERARDTGEDAAQVTFDALATPLEEWLLRFRDRDEQAAQAIAAQRAERERDATYIRSQLAQLQAGLENIQSSLEARVEDNLRAVSTALDTLDREAGGFGADLHWEIQRPHGPSDTWVWKVTPRWKRSASGRMLPYDHATNSAQEKLFSVHLVLAALLASPHPRGRVLILDELGDSLGEDHRRRVLEAVRSVAERYGITVLGTCQDAVMPDASSFCGEVLYFHYPSKSDALNAPTRMFGFDSNGERVALTADVLRDTRPWASN
jgi:hypothetical protein